MGLFDFVKKGISSVVNTGKQIGQKALDTGKQLGEKTGLGKVVGKIKEAGSNVLSKAGGLASSIISKAEDTFNSIKDKIPFGDTIANLANKIPKVKAFTSGLNIAKKIAEIAKNIKNRVSSAGSATQEKIDDIINSGLGLSSKGMDSLTNLVSNSKALDNIERVGKSEDY